MERGFPMPKGCYYKGYPTGNRREALRFFKTRSYDSMAGLPGLRGQEWPAAGHHVSDGRML